MHALFFKKDQGNTAQDSTNGAMFELPRWSGLVSLPPPEAFAQSKLASTALAVGANQSADLQRLGKGNTIQFTLSSGDCRSDENGEKTPVQTMTMDYRGHHHLGFSQPPICGRYADQCFGAYSSYATQIGGRIMLPPSRNDDEGPIFVNAKQCNGIMRRRKKRAEVEMANKVLKVRKPYMHLSRHLHAKRRPRGKGGRFLKMKSSNGSMEKAAGKQWLPEGVGTGSQISEVLQSDRGARSKGRNGSRCTSPNSEVTSHLFPTAANYPPLQSHRLHPFFQPFPDVANTGLGSTMDPGTYLKI